MIRHILYLTHAYAALHPRRDYCGVELLRIYSSIGLRYPRHQLRRLIDI